MIKRNLYLNLWHDLAKEKQLVFLSGPRQVGKTTLALEIANQFKNKLYFNWDILDQKKQFIQNPTFFTNLNRRDESTPLIILDEIHKYRHWKNYLKGIYDQYAAEFKFIVSGSGRLDLYQKGGDSLAGRYFQLHLFPFTIAELGNTNRKLNDFIRSPQTGLPTHNLNILRDQWYRLFNVGGFPEPFTRGTQTLAATL